jgi:hypothetical protein
MSSFYSRIKRTLFESKKRGRREVGVSGIDLHELLDNYDRLEDIERTSHLIKDLHNLGHRDFCRSMVRMLFDAYEKHPECVKSDIMRFVLEKEEEKKELNTNYHNQRNHNEF